MIEGSMRRVGLHRKKTVRSRGKGAEGNKGKESKDKLNSCNSQQSPSVTREGSTWGFAETQDGVAKDS